MKKFLQAALALLILLPATALAAQDATAPAGGTTRPVSDTAPRAHRVFVDCPSCDEPFVRQGLAFVELVRDPRLADTHLLVSTAPTTSGGETAQLEAIDRRSARRDTLTFVWPPTATPVEKREALLRGMRFALVPALIRRGSLDRLEISVRDSGTGTDATRAPSTDRWRRWVLRASVSGDSQRDDNYGQLGLEGSLSAVRVTDAWKLSISYRDQTRRSRFRLSDSSTLRVTQRDRSMRGLAVRSIGAHAGLGAQWNVDASIFQNVRSRLQLRAAFEANLFPYEEATRRQLLARYTVGLDAMRYLDTTIFGRLRETRPLQAAMVRFDQRERWGGAWLRAGWSQYLHDGSRRRTTLDFNVDWRVATGVNLFVGGSYAKIADQLSIVGANLDDQERLLRLRELRSGASSYTALGVSFTFGSRLTEVVNLRFPEW